MELNFTEINNTQNSYQTQDIDSEKYWEHNTSTYDQNQRSKKKKVNFDDILTNMNLVVNNKGILQFMAPVNQVNIEEQYQQKPQLQQLQQNVERKNEPLDPSVKHSFIFNKYFKDYKDVHVPQREVKVPKTKEEYIQMVIEENQRQIYERKRIAQIKSKKLLFTSTTNYTPIGLNTIQASKNSLRKMSFY